MWKEKCKLGNFKYEDALALAVVTHVFRWQFSPKCYLLSGDMEKAQTLDSILQTLIQSLTCAKMSTLPMSVTSSSLEVYSLQFSEQCLSRSSSESYRRYSEAKDIY